MAVAGRPWNRNVHYHDLVLAAVPAPCRRALDVGCGGGRLASELAEVCGEVIGLDNDAPTLARARATYQQSNLSFVDGDVMTYPVAAGSFDVIASIATLHHLPLEPALERFRVLLRPGGVLVVIGLYRLESLTDYIVGGAATILSVFFRLIRGTEHVNAPIRDPETTLREIRDAVHHALPGAVVKRELFYRYSLVWRNPSA